MKFFLPLAESTITFTPKEVLLSLLVTVSVFALAALGRFLARLIRKKKKRKKPDSA